MDATMMIAIAIAAILSVFLVGHYICKKFDYKTSAKHLYQCGMQQMQGTQNDQNNQTANVQQIILKDLFIKGKSYAIMNKVSFMVGLVSTLSVILLPIIGMLPFDSIKSWNTIISVTQVCCAILAPMAIYTYIHYKQKQCRVETLMRFCVYNALDFEEFKIRVIEEMNKMDKGFDFTSYQQNQLRSD